MRGIDFLRGVNSGAVTALEGDTVVIGGGNAAIGVSRAAVRLGSGPANMLCLEKDEEMPTVPDEKSDAAETLDDMRSELTEEQIRKRSAALAAAYQ